ncbi:hypothetical protein [Thalassoroseus pseudoceratinae]|uniref:hypothetical protein n=1 Tax=Thalassoroseus pseudoceratinae TaxID=2713176 RepID=UPI0014246B9C|nr:hypothetical protein [Thalassoroseus pseudoceratinae]
MAKRKPTKSNPLKMFSWGYWGWGNATEQLVKAVDAVERSRGFKPPIFVDVRKSRSVRAKGFSGNAFGDLLGERRHQWMNDLGNAQIGTNEGGVKIVKPKAAQDLFDLALEAHTENRRIVFFCSCPYLREADGGKCHRWTVGSLLLKAAKRAGVPLELQEWPGDDPHEKLVVKLDDEELKRLWRNGGYVPLGEPRQVSKYASLPHGSIVYLQSRQNSDEHFDIISGPAIYRNGQWKLPIHEAYEVEDQAAWTESKRLRKQHAWDARCS